MRYGMCTGVEYPERVKIIADAGFDYVESSFCNLSRADDCVFEAFANALEENRIKCEAVNGFLPKDLPILGDEYDREKVTAYLEKGMARGTEIGLKTVVFGSGKARAIPDGMSYAEAFRGIGEFLRETASPIAEKYGIEIVIEPLRKDECSIINTVKEGVMLAVLSGCGNVSGLGDLYHMVGSGDTYNDIRQLKGSIKHAHINNPIPKKCTKRDFPADVNEYDYKGFVDALEFAGCERCSVEAQCLDFDTEALIAAKVLKAL